MWTACCASRTWLSLTVGPPTNGTPHGAGSIARTGGFHGQSRHRLSDTPGAGKCARQPRCNRTSAVRGEGRRGSARVLRSPRRLTSRRWRRSACRVDAASAATSRAPLRCIDRAWTVAAPRSRRGPMPDGGAFVEDLRAMIDAGRAFGRHPLWLRIAEGRVPPSALAPFAVQFFLQVREFPRAVSALHSSCPDMHERAELAESLYEEETGRISGCNVSHPDLFIRFGEGVGVPREAMEGGMPLRATAAL